MLTLLQCINLRQALQRRLQDLVHGSWLRPQGGAGRTGDRLAHEVLACLRGGEDLARRGLDVLPLGIGDACWWSLVARAARKSFDFGLTRGERRAVHMAVGSALRLALLEGRTYSGRLVPKKYEEATGWSSQEALAFAERFCEKGRWNGSLAPLAFASPSALNDRELALAIKAMVLGEMTLSQFADWRALGESYLSYASLDRGLALPWTTQRRPIVAATEMRRVG